jgi:serine/threonine protein phosphatase PrpC
MPAGAIEEVQFFAEPDKPEGESHRIATGMAVVRSIRCPGKQTANEDAAAILCCDARRGVLAVADGFGGQPAGDQASQLALAALAEAVEEALSVGGILRAGILNGFEKANQEVSALGVGAATTLAVAEIEDGSVRPYHVGDSVILVVGQRGKIKLQTVPHSPVGYAVEAGWLEEAEAMHHEERHLVSNMVGSAEMRIEIGSALQLRPRDTLLLASDGLFDNLHIDEIVQYTRKGPLGSVSKLLANECDARMRTPREGLPCKPDDLTFIVFRLQDSARQ